MTKVEEQIRRSQALVKQIQPMLAGQGPEAQAAALADLVAMWLAGHHPSLRYGQLAQFFVAVVKLSVINEKMMFGDAGFPKDGLQ
jgi:hypothetical protein